MWCQKSCTVQFRSAFIHLCNKEQGVGTAQWRTQGRSGSCLVIAKPLPNVCIHFTPHWTNLIWKRQRLCSVHESVFQKMKSHSSDVLSLMTPVAMGEVKPSTKPSCPTLLMRKMAKSALNSFKLIFQIRAYESVTSKWDIQEASLAEKQKDMKVDTWSLVWSSVFTLPAHLCCNVLQNISFRQMVQYTDHGLNIWLTIPTFLIL